MKKIVSILTLASALFAVSVQQSEAQGVGNVATIVDATPTPISIYNSVASNLPVSTISIDCSGQQNVAVSWSVQLASAGTENHGIRFVGIAEPGVRPSTPTLADGFYMTVAANGTTPVIVHTNFNVKGFARLDCTYITNGTAALATNLVRYYVKKAAP